MNKQAYTTPLMSVTKTDLEIYLQTISVEGSEHQIGGSDEGDDENPRSKERGFDDFGSLW